MWSVFGGTWLPNQCCKLFPRPLGVGDFLPCQGQPEPSIEGQAKICKKEQGGGQPGARRSRLCSTGSCCLRAGGGEGRREEKEELRSPGPGASPLTALGSDALSESRRERNKVWLPFFFFFPLPLVATCRSAGGRRAGEQCTFASLSCLPRVYWFFASVFLPF